MVRSLKNDAFLSFNQDYALSLEHFLIENQNGHGDTPLHQAAWHRRLDQVIAALKDSGETFSPTHFLVKDDHGYTALHGAAREGQLDQIFQPSLWQGRLTEMLQLWSHVPEKDRSQIDFEQVSGEASLSSRPALPRPAADAFRAARRPGFSPPDGESPSLQRGQ
ncbi:MAG: ankyrin repeat domain-containing protein [Verrucomicrobium sp.]|nr:ankyrin repeat domain-containing protein [Verrucomicrobium sp.]